MSHMCSFCVCVALRSSWLDRRAAVPQYIPDFDYKKKGKLCVERQEERASLKLRRPRFRAVMGVRTAMQTTGPRPHAGVAAKRWCRRRRRVIIREKEGKYYMGLGYTPALCRRVWISFQPARAQHQAPAADTLLRRHKTPASVCLRVLRGPLARLHPSDRPWSFFSDCIFAMFFAAPSDPYNKVSSWPKTLPLVFSSHS